MSASWKPEDGYMMVIQQNPYLIVKECEIFDNKVDYDIKDIKKQLKREKMYRRMAFLRVLQAPFEYFYSRLFVSKEIAQRTYKQFFICIKFLRKKITFKEFKDANFKLG